MCHISWRDIKCELNAVGLVCIMFRNVYKLKRTILSLKANTYLKGFSERQKAKPFLRWYVTKTWFSPASYRFQYIRLNFKNCIIKWYIQLKLKLNWFHLNFHLGMKIYSFPWILFDKYRKLKNDLYFVNPFLITFNSDIECYEKNYFGANISIFKLFQKKKP